MPLIVAIIGSILLLGGAVPVAHPIYRGDRAIGVSVMLAGAAALWLAFHL